VPPIPARLRSVELQVDRRHAAFRLAEDLAIDPLTHLPDNRVFLVRVEIATLLERHHDLAHERPQTVLKRIAQVILREIHLVAARFVPDVPRARFADGRVDGVEDEPAVLECFRQCALLRHAILLELYVLQRTIGGDCDFRPGGDHLIREIANDVHMTR
jgi:hypothetical protein